MEIVLQWLDELDDLVFAGFSIWGRLRRLCLAIALGAALALLALPRLGIAADPMPLLTAVSLAGLVAWAGVATVAAIAERNARTSTA
jgi:hypothetical protein